MSSHWLSKTRTVSEITIKLLLHGSPTRQQLMNCRMLKQLLASPSSIPYLQLLFIWSFLQTGYGSGRPLTWVFELWASLTPHRKLQSFCSLQNIALPPFLYKSVTPQVLPCIRSSSKSLLFRVDFASFSLCKKVGDW